MTGEHFQALSPRFQRIALDAVNNTARLGWTERLFFLSAAGEKHEVWRKAYAIRHVSEQVPEWSKVVSAVVELWGPAEIGCFEMAAIYTLSDDRNWRNGRRTLVRFIRLCRPARRLLARSGGRVQAACRPGA